MLKSRKLLRRNMLSNRTQLSLQDNFIKYVFLKQIEKFAKVFSRKRRFAYSHLQKKEKEITRY